MSIISLHAEYDHQHWLAFSAYAIGLDLFSFEKKSVVSSKKLKELGCDKLLMLQRVNTRCSC